ncbi:hypothetical protein [Pyrodictium abyssi]|uniref:hypothetical protein n=1 Tax=Pyrodictium abyssi TaxID=54256 RepID=UPI0030C6AC98
MVFVGILRTDGSRSFSYTMRADPDAVRYVTTCRIYSFLIENLAQCIAKAKEDLQSQPRGNTTAAAG